MDSLAYIDADLIEAADRPVGRKKTSWVRRVSLAACLCLIAGSVFLWRGLSQPDGDRIWTKDMQPADYFADSGPANRESPGSLVMMPYAAELNIDGERAALEAESVLPNMPEHTEQHFTVECNGDGSLYKVSFWWMRRSEGSLDGYSDLTMTAAPREPHEVADNEYVPGTGPAVTVTVRDGVEITGEGTEDTWKALTWETEQGWYQITGSGRDSFEDVAALLDWFWDHPLSLDRFAALAQETVSVSDRAEHPEAFAGRIPDFAALGYETETERVGFADKNGETVPVWFDGVYTSGGTRIRWTVSTGADADAWAICLGRPDEITEEAVTAALEARDSFTVFLDGAYMYHAPPYGYDYMAELRLENGTPAEAWEVLQTMQSG